MQEIFHPVIVVGFIAGDPRAFRQIKRILFQGWRITATARRQEEFNRLAGFGDQEMDLQAVEVTPFAG
jgi:hypothetical protein